MLATDREIREVKDRVKKKLHLQLKAKGKTAHELIKSFKHQLKPILDELRLLASVNTNNVSEVQRLLDTGVNPNAVDMQSRSALHIAVSKGYTEVVRQLLEYRADPNKRDILHNTPLHLAACSHNLPIISLLIEAGADVSSHDIHGRHPLQLARSRLQILQNNWKHGAIEMLQLKFEVQQIINSMISVWNSKAKETETQVSVDNLEMMKLSIESNPSSVDDQISQLLLELQEFQIT